MTIDEAIEILSDYCCMGSREDESTSAAFGSSIYKVEDALEMARQALREKLEAEKEEPLTKEEMDCRRKKHLPVWAVELWTGENNSGWALAGTRNALSQDFICAALWYDTYGMEWIAYDHPTQVIRYDRTAI